MNFGQLVSNAVALAMGFSAGLLVSLWADNATVDVQHLREVEAQLVEARRAVRDRDALLSASGIKASDEAVGYAKSQALIGMLLDPAQATRVGQALREHQATLGD